VNRRLDPIIGDLLEEYREVVLPVRGRVRAMLWFARQLASLVPPWRWGLALGALVGAQNILDSYLWPLPHDNAAGVLALWTSVLVAWGAIGTSAASRSRRLRDGILGGAFAAAVSMGIMGAANFVRVYIVLDLATHHTTLGQFAGGFMASHGDALSGFFQQEAIDWLQGVLGAAGLGACAGAIGGGLTLRRARPTSART